MLYEKTGQHDVYPFVSLEQSAGPLHTCTFSTEASPFVWQVSAGVPTLIAELLHKPQ